MRMLTESPRFSKRLNFPQHPGNQLFYGSTSKTRLFGPNAAASRNDGFSRVFDSLAFRFLEIPCVSDYDDFGIVAPSPVIRSALKTEAGPSAEFLGLPISFKRDRPAVIATLPLADDGVRKLTKPAADARADGATSVAPLRKLACRLCFARTAATGRFGASALKPIYSLIASSVVSFPGGVDHSLRWRESPFPT